MTIMHNYIDEGSLTPMVKQVLGDTVIFTIKIKISCLQGTKKPCAVIAGPHCEV
jgi:hypothetical protein